LENIVIEQILLHFEEKGGDDCFDVIHDSVDKIS
jgi:hypothetical protein